MYKANRKKPQSASPQIIVPNKEIWEPVMFPKQRKFFNDTTRFRLATGPRYCGKSRVVDHTILKHAWGTKNCRIAMIHKSVRNANVGAWADITTFIMQEWLDANLTSPLGHKFDWVKEPSIKGNSRMQYCQLRSYFGTVSEIQLHSLDYDGDIAAKLMNSSFSLIYFSELQSFVDPAVFKISILQLRMAGLPYEKHLFMADTNPPESGPDHFAYKMWFGARDQTDPPEDCTTPEQIAEFREYQKEFGLHEFELDDNIYADPKVVRDLKATYRDDPVGWDRFIVGRWTRAASTKEYHFKSVFKRELHVMGDISNNNPANWQILVPSHECTTLTAGFDIGQSVNHAFVIAEPVILDNDQTAFNILDELVYIGREEPLVDFIEEALEKIYALEKLIGERVEIRAWSDSSAWQFSAKSANIDAMLVEKMSFGRIVLMSATNSKKHGGVRRRIKMIQDLLKQQRLLVSANCVHTIDMFDNLRSGRLRGDGSGEVIVRGSIWKHAYDSLSYMVWQELFSEMSEGHTKPAIESASRLISVPL